MMVRIHGSRWGLYCVSGLLCLSIPLLTVVSLRHRLDLYLVDQETEIQFDSEIAVPIQEDSSSLLGSTSWPEQLSSTPRAIATPTQARIETPAEQQQSPSPASSPATSVTPEAPLETTTENPAPAVSGYNYALSQSECSAQFPDLYKDLDRAVTLRKEIGNITPSDIDLSWKPDGAVRAMVYNQKLYIIEAKFDGNGYHSTRGLAVLHQLDRAISTSPFPLPNTEFSFTIDDIGDAAHAHHTIWTFSRQVVDKEMWLMPDFGYWAWPLDLVGEYEQVRMEMRENEVTWEKKIPKALWRGAVKTNKDVRGALMKATKRKEWADVQEVTWKNRTDVKSSTAVPMAEHCAYQFLIHTEGRSYSGRGKYLLNCESVTIMHKPEWFEPHNHLYVSSGPKQNIVEVERDFSDLEEKIEELLKDKNRAQAIAKNSVATFRDRYLTPAAQACYWRQLLVSWAEVSFTPEAWETVDGRKRLRGVPFESFTIKALDPPAKKCSFWKSLIFQC